MASRRSIKVSVSVPSGERINMSIEPGTTAQDVITALIQSDKLPAEDSQGNELKYELVNDATMSSLAGDKPLLDQAVQDGAELRVKLGSRVAR